MAEDEIPSEPKPEAIVEESKMVVANLRELVGDLKSVEEFERSIRPTSD